MARKRNISEVSEAMTLTTPSTTVIEYRASKDINGEARKYIKSSTKHSGVRDFNHRQLTDILCPVWRATRLWYGNSFEMTDGAITAVPTAKIIGWNACSGSLESFVHLPKSITTGCTYSLEQLITKASDINNFTQITARPATPLSLGAYEQQFGYLGGSVQHKFTNTGTTTIEMTFYLSTPRRYLGHRVDAQGQLPMQNAWRSKINNVSLRNLATPIDVPADYNAGDDVMFAYKKTDTLLHFDWKSQPPKRVRLAPGQELHYTVRLPSFHFTNSAFNASIGPGVDPEFLPFCTVVLDVQCRGEMCQTATDVVGYGPGQYSHVQKEYHACRAVPYAPQENAIIINNLDLRGVNADTAFLHINPQNEAQNSYSEL